MRASRARMAPTGSDSPSEALASGHRKFQFNPAPLEGIEVHPLKVLLTAILYSVQDAGVRLPFPGFFSDLTLP